MLEAVRRLGEKLGRRLTDNGALSVGEGFDAYLSTSSAGGGLQILVSGLAKTVTAKSAFRAACAAGGVLLDVLAIDDGRKPHEKVEAIENLRPDMILIAGGVDGGDVANVVRMASVILAAHLKPKYVPEGRMPVVYAGNADAREQIESLLSDRVELSVVANLRPRMDIENLDPTRRAIHELFTSHVMARAPGYLQVSGWTALPIEPTPVAVESMLEIISRRQKRNIIMVDIGGATTDVFSFYEDTYNRTVSANLGMSYSASNVLLEAGARNIMRWLAAEISERRMRNMIANKCIHPARIPRNESELEVEQACAREALRLALKTHRQLSVRVRSTDVKDWTRATFWSDRKFRPEFAEEEYIRMQDVALIFGSGGVLSHAPQRWQAAMMLVDGLGPVGITQLGVDSVFMTPHLGALARLSVDAAYRTFFKECHVPLGACISLAGRVVPGQHAATVRLHGATSEDFDISGGELRLIPAALVDAFEVEILPARKVDAGEGPGRPVTGTCRGGEVGIIIDARGRPVQFPEDPAERRAAVERWRRAFEEAAREARRAGESREEKVEPVEIHGLSPAVSSQLSTFPIPQEKIVRTRRLAFNSDVRVAIGDRVRPDTVVAVTMLPLPRLFFLSAFRTLPGGSLEGHVAEWLVGAGERVDMGTPIARFTPVEFAPGEIIAPGGLRAGEAGERVFKSPLAGVIESITGDSGLIQLREEIDYGRRRAAVQVGHRLGLWGRKLKRYIKHKNGEFVEKGQILAQRIETGDSGSPGSIAFARAPIAGVITGVDLEKGVVRLKREFREVKLAAGFFGTVSAIGAEGIEIATEGRRVQGVCGIGGEAFGRLRVAAKGPGERLAGSDITGADAGMILVGGSEVTPRALKDAADAGVAGIITGGADHLDLCDFLGEDFAVAVTGREKTPFPIIITGEFGETPMDEELFEFFREHEGSWAHLNSTTHMRAGVIRPEIIVMSDRH